MPLKPNHAPKNSSIRPEAEDRAAQYVVEEGIGLCVVMVDHDVAREVQEVLSEMHVHAVLPIRVSDGLRRTCQKQLPGHEDVVSYRVCREVGEVPETHR